MRTLPPRPALKAAVAVLGPVVASAALGWWLVGPLAAIGVVLGVVAGAQFAVVEIPAVQRVVAAVCLMAPVRHETLPTARARVAGT